MVSNDQQFFVGQKHGTTNVDVALEQESLVDHDGKDQRKLGELKEEGKKVSLFEDDVYNLAGDCVSKSDVAYPTHTGRHQDWQVVGSDDSVSDVYIVHSELEDLNEGQEVVLRVEEEEIEAYVLNHFLVELSVREQLPIPQFLISGVADELVRNQAECQKSQNRGKD